MQPPESPLSPPVSPTAPSFGSLPPDVVAAVFSRLPPLSLAVASCVSRAWRAQAADQPSWRASYASLWPAPTADNSSPAASAAAPGLPAAPAAPTTAQSCKHAWQVRYGERQLLARCWMGRAANDRLAAGSGTATKACCLLPELGLLFSGGVDRVVRAWDLCNGIQLAARCEAGGGA